MHPARARFILSILAVFVVVFDLSAEANETHVWNLEIEPHARFHIVWQLATNCMLTGLALAIMWGAYLEDENREVQAIRISAGFLSMEPLGF